MARITKRSVSEISCFIRGTAKKKFGKQSGVGGGGILEGTNCECGVRRKGDLMQGFDHVDRCEIFTDARNFKTRRRK